MKTRVCRLYGQGDIRIEEADVAAPGPGEVLVAMAAGGICGSDLHYYQDGGFGPIRVREPIVLGHEVAGTVRAVGAGVEGVAPGDRVAVNPSRPCNACRYCLDGLQQHCLAMRFFGSALRFPHEQGGFRDLMVVDAFQCVRVDNPEVSLAEAACAEPLAVCLHALNRAGASAGNLAGKSVLVTGAGPIGILALLTARAFGATRLFVSDVNDTRLALAAEVVPGVVAINPAREDVGERVRAGTQDGIGCDVALECVGNDRALQSCLDAVRKQGVIVQTGLHPGKGSVDFFQLTFKDAEIRGSWCYPTHGWPRTIELIASGAIPARRVVTKRIALDEAVAEGFEALLDPAGSQLKILIDLSR